ncbi:MULTISPECIES: hypothetical protein [Microbacterium]|uniref:hypothetical protein n=1 Tax=Microbacterium TaxID=33882 RepID=UPI0021A29EB2|nr:MULTISPECIES: hypothetical protein [Microbacterium]MCT1364740.1 hypothetical protein [Microbacterium sp. p3-SID131]MCT1376133.1 hypothetical protein [Microbacterium sp. p3-SID337]
MSSERIRRTPAGRRMVGALVGLIVAAALSGCGATVPADPDGTLDRVTGGELRVGTSPDPGLVETDGGRPHGPVVALVDGFAASLDAHVTWTVATEESLVGMLETGDLDLVAGGLTPDTPWIDKAGVTRGYPGIEGAGGRELVMLVPLGENAFLSALETYLDGEVDR